MKIVLSMLGALIGLFAGFYGAFWLYPVFHAGGDCMWRLAAFGYAVVVGVPVGTISVCLIGLIIGAVADRWAGREGAPMKIVLAIPGAVIGPFAGYYGVFWLYYALHKGDRMWQLAACRYAFLIGVPIGTISFCLVGRAIGALVDKSSTQKRLQREDRAWPGPDGAPNRSGVDPR